MYFGLRTGLGVRAFGLLTGPYDAAAGQSGLLAGLLIGVIGAACGLALARFGRPRLTAVPAARVAGLIVIALVVSAPLWFSPVTGVSIH